MRKSSSFFLLLSTAVCVCRPTVATTTTLPLNDINVVVVTDVHSWVAGHGYHEKDLDADYGDVLSFYERLSILCDRDQRDLFFVMNGDFVDGTGLSEHPPERLMSILEKMKWDAVNIGNHELYRKDTIEAISADGGFVDHWNGGYLTTNVRLVDTGELIGSRFKFLRGRYGRVLLTFGFLYDMVDENPVTVVEKVETVVREPWFSNVLQGKKGDFDAILVLAHMDYRHPLVKVILDVIREVCGPEMPVQFVTGHTHIRGYTSPDVMSSSLEFGRFLDTVGFASFTNQGYFQHAFLDANVATLMRALDMDTNATTADDFKTVEGQALSDFIWKTQQSMGLLNVLGCAPRSYYVDKALDQPDSLWGLYARDILPSTLFKHEDDASSNIVIQSAGDFRYDLFQGAVTVTDLIAVSPFKDTFHLVAKGIAGSKIRTLLMALNSREGDKVLNPTTVPDYIHSAVEGGLKKAKRYDIYTTDFHLRTVKEYLERITSETYLTVAFDDTVFVDDLWRTYVSENWSCEKTGAPRKTSPLRIVLAITLFLTGCGVIALVLPRCYRKSFHGKIKTRRVATDEDDDEKSTESSHLEEKRRPQQHSFAQNSFV